MQIHTDVKHKALNHMSKVRRNIVISFTCLVMFVLLAGCYRMRASKGGGEIGPVGARKLVPSDVQLMPGYQIEVVATDLTFPSALTFDDKGTLYVVEAGYVYGEKWEEPRLIRIADGVKTIVAKGGKNGPWNGVAFHNGNFFVSEGGELEGGRILRISPSGEMTVIAANLPSQGDHHTNGLVVKDGYIYFGQGTATNSAVVGTDNADFGWLKRKRDFHDIPCRDVVLSGRNYQSLNPLTDDPKDEVTTGAFVPFGTVTSPGQVIKGSVPCTGAIMRVPVSGGEIEMTSWGLRNPFGLALSPEGKLYVTENAYDERGSRPVWGAGDVLWEVKQDTWYGWPEFSGAKAIPDNAEFKPPAGDKVDAVLQNHPQRPPDPVTEFGVHSSANGFDFSHSAAFGFEGEAFVALFGDMAPNVGKVMAPVGFKVVRVNVETGVVRDFAVNKGKRHGPATFVGSGGLERPVAVKFSPDGRSLYVVDFGILRMTDKGPDAMKSSGSIWRIEKK